MEFRTEININKAPFEVKVGSQSLFIGSCFADNIGSLFAEHRLKCMVNPYGVLYNPFSVADALSAIAEQREYKESELFFDGHLWHSPSHHGRFSGINKAEVVDGLNQVVHRANNFLVGTDVLFVTLGTAWVYKHIERGIIVANCHKQPSHVFQRYRLSVSDIVQRYALLLPLLKQIVPKLNVVFTISPVRHMKDTAHGNQLSKSVLLLAVEELENMFPFVHYFPAYELVLDDLRDYRFYDVDMLHPNSLAIDYIWGKLQQYCFGPEMLGYLPLIHKVVEALNHRPLHPDSPAYITFLNTLQSKLDQTGRLFPQADLLADKLLVAKLLGKER
jgi:hypothetical protein